MPTLVSTHGHDISGATTTQPSNADIGEAYFDTTLGYQKVNDGTTFSPPTGIVSKEVTFTETTGAGTYTGSVSVPAGATLVDVIVHAVALWDATTSATMKVGDVADDDGIYTGVNLKATDLLAGESLSLYQAGGKQGADLGDAATPGTQMSRRYLSTARVISGVVTTVGAAGSAGRTRMTVVYSLGTPAAATKV